MLDAIPSEIRTYQQWIVWRYETRDDKQTKIPYDAKTGQLAAVDNPSTWTTFEYACSMYLNTRDANGNLVYSGIGFVLTEGDPFGFIDLDIKGEISPDDISRQIQIQRTFNSYSERSPSGKGLHIIIKGHVPRGRKRSNIEVYSSGRYMTMTGDVFDDKPIEERQSEFQILWSEMGVGTPVYSDHDDAPQTADDAEIYHRASNAANGGKFVSLWNAQWAEVGYPSQSEADFALIDIIAFYTQNREQIARLFRASWAGQREKAMRVDYIDTMINRSFDRMLPQINFVSLQSRINALVEMGFTGWQKGNGAAHESHASAPFAHASNASEPTKGIAGNGHMPQTRADVKFPPGLMGDIATFIYYASQRPVGEVALAASIGLMAGICGRAYNTPTGAGLNLYTLLIALSGVGKESMSIGISRLIESIAVLQPGTEKVPSIREFLGPSEYRSDAALIKTISEQPSMVSIFGEFGLKLKKMHAPHANAHIAGLKDVFLDLYSKSGFGNIYRPIAYSDHSKNTVSVNAPAFSILAESTPSTFYDALDESMIAHGLLPRFLIIEYFGIRVPSNESHSTMMPTTDLQSKLGTLAIMCHTMQREGKLIQVQFHSEDAYNLAKTFDKFCDAQINSTANEVIRDLWNRGHLKVLKLASLVSIGLDHYRPLITVDAWRWAQQIVQMDIERMVTRFEKGDVGIQTTNEARQQELVLKAMREFLFMPWSKIGGYKAGTPAMQNARVIPASYISRRLSNSRFFKDERIGVTNAINRTLKSLQDNGIIADVTGKARFDIGGKMFMISDIRYLTPEDDPP